MRRLLSLLAVALLVVGCGGIGSLPNFTIPPINLQSLPPFTIPSGLLATSSGACAFITPEEMATIWGSAPTLTDTSDGCSFTFSNFSTVNVSTESNSEIASSKFLFGDSAKDITVGGLAGVTGVFVGQPAVHVQRGTDQMQVLGILTGSDDATIAKLVQVATLAISRWP